MSCYELDEKKQMPRNTLPSDQQRNARRRTADASHGTTRRLLLFCGPSAPFQHPQQQQLTFPIKTSLERGTQLQSIQSIQSPCCSLRCARNMVRMRMGSASRISAGKTRWSMFTSGRRRYTSGRRRQTRTWWTGRAVVVGMKGRQRTRVWVGHDRQSLRLVCSQYHAVKLRFLNESGGTSLSTSGRAVSCRTHHALSL